MKGSAIITSVHEPVVTQCSAEMFHADVQFLETRWDCVPIAGGDLPLIDLGTGDPLVFVPIHEHLEFVYARQMRAFSTSRRVVLYRRYESRTRFVSLTDRVDELCQVLDSLGIACTDFMAHGDAAMVLFEFALRYPERCRSLVIVALGADYRIEPHPFIWFLHELFLRLPVEGLVPAFLLRRVVLRYIMHFDTNLQSKRQYCTRRSAQGTTPTQCHGDHGPPGSAQGTTPTVRGMLSLNAGWYELPEQAQDDAPTQEGGLTLTEIPRALIEEQFCKIVRWPAVYRYSVLPVIHSFDIRARLAALTMPILLINRWDDALSPEAQTAWLAQRLPNCTYHVVAGRGRFFLYSEAEHVTPLIETFLRTR